jgi:hypothetical protein
VVALLTILPAAVAVAAEPPAAHQYVESVPPAGGDRGDDPNEPAEPLPADVQRQVQAQGGADAAALEAVATSPALGASRADKETENAAENGSDVEGPSTARTAATAPAEGDSSTMAILLAGVAVVSVVAAGFAVARRRSRPH